MAAGPGPVHCRIRYPRQTTAAPFCVSEGFDVVGASHDLCRAVGLPIDWRGDLSPIAEWLRSRMDSETIMDAVRSAKPPADQELWQYYHRRVRERGRREDEPPMELLIT